MSSCTLDCGIRGVSTEPVCECVLSPQKEGEFTLHGRAILEMEQFIRETYPDAVKICNICHSLLIQVLMTLGVGS